MGYEVRAALRLTDEEVARWCAALARSGYEVITTSPRRVSLRFAGDERRAPWPEDVTIDFGEAVEVVFHAGTRAERASLLEGLRARLAELGWKGELEAM